MKSTTSPIFTEIGKISGPPPVKMVSPVKVIFPLIATSIDPPFQPSPNESYNSRLKSPQDPAREAVVNEKGPVELLNSFALQASWI